MWFKWSNIYKPVLIATDTKLVVRFTEAEKRRFKSLAVSRGTALQEAVHQALETWASQLKPEATPPLEPCDLLAGFDLEKPRRLF